MNKISPWLVCFGLFGLLSACVTSKQVSDEQNQAIKTAKVNAQLGIAYTERNDIQRAKQKLLLALEEAPGIPEPWYSMGYFYEATGNKQEANEYYLKAIAVAPTRGDAQNNYGTFLCRSGDYKASIAHFVLAAKDRNYLNPADAYENAGLCALRIPDKALAKQYFTRAVEEDSRKSVSRKKLAEM